MSKNMRRVRPQDFENAVIKALGEYGDEVNEKLDKLTKSAARETRSEMKATVTGNTGRYAAGWSNKAKKGGRFNLAQVVYNRTDYQLIHLLEKSHDTGGGGHYPRPGGPNYTGEMKRVEEEQVNKYYEEVVDSL